MTIFYEVPKLAKLIYDELDLRTGDIKAGMRAAVASRKHPLSVLRGSG